MKIHYKQLEQSGLAGVTLNDNAAPAANVIYSSLKSGGGGFTPPATTTSLGTIQLAGVLLVLQHLLNLASRIGRSFSTCSSAVNVLVLHPVPLQVLALVPELLSFNWSHSAPHPDQVGSFSLLPMALVGSYPISQRCVGFLPLNPSMAHVGAFTLQMVDILGPMQLASFYQDIGVDRIKQYQVTNAMDRTPLGPSLQMSPAGV